MRIKIRKTKPVYRARGKTVFDLWFCVALLLGSVIVAIVVSCC